MSLFLFVCDGWSRQDDHEEVRRQRVMCIRARALTSGVEGGGAPSPGGPMPMGAGGGAAPPIFANPNTTDLSSFGNGQGQGMQPMRAYVVERDIQQTTSRVRRLSEFATLG